jgi:broad specificity phosphatase PhoE
LKDIPVDRIYSSDLRRAYDTALATAVLKNMPVVKTAGMREIYGGLWEGETFRTLGERYGADFDVWCNDFGNAQCTGGESVRDLQRRIVEELRRMPGENPERRVMVFCHATPIRVFRAYCEGVNAQAMGQIPWASNASVTQAVYENGTFRLCSYGVDHFMGSMVTALPEDV